MLPAGEDSYCVAAFPIAAPRASFNAALMHIKEQTFVSVEPSGINRIYRLYREEGLMVTTAIARAAARDDSAARRAIA